MRLLDGDDDDDDGSDDNDDDDTTAPCTPERCAQRPEHVMLFPVRPAETAAPHAGTQLRPQNTRLTP